MVFAILCFANQVVLLPWSIFGVFLWIYAAIALGWGALQNCEGYKWGIPVGLEWGVLFFVVVTAPGVAALLDSDFRTRPDFYFHMTACWRILEESYNIPAPKPIDVLGHWFASDAVYAYNQAHFLLALLVKPTGATPHELLTWIAPGLNYMRLGVVYSISMAIFRRKSIAAICLLSVIPIDMVWAGNAFDTWWSWKTFPRILGSMAAQVACMIAFTSIKRGTSVAFFLAGASLSTFLFHHFEFVLLLIGLSCIAVGSFLAGGIKSQIIKVTFSVIMIMVACAPLILLRHGLAASLGDFEPMFEPLGAMADWVSVLYRREILLVVFIFPFFARAWRTRTITLRIMAWVFFPLIISVFPLARDLLVHWASSEIPNRLFRIVPLYLVVGAGLFGFLQSCRFRWRRREIFAGSNLALACLVAGLDILKNYPEVLAGLMAYGIIVSIVMGISWQRRPTSSSEFHAFGIYLKQVGVVSIIPIIMLLGCFAFMWHVRQFIRSTDLIHWSDSVTKLQPLLQRIESKSKVGVLGNPGYAFTALGPNFHRCHHATRVPWAKACSVTPPDWLLVESGTIVPSRHWKEHYVLVDSIPGITLWGIKSHF
jgi:hypothetical protein